MMPTSVRMIAGNNLNRFNIGGLVSYFRSELNAGIGWLLVEVKDDHQRIEGHPFYRSILM